MNPANLGVAIVGCGRIGTRRAQQAAAHPASRVVRAIDADVAAVRALSEAFACVASSEWRDALDDPRVDVVSIATPNALAAEIAVAALNAGKHVLVEKPMGCDLEQARAIAQAACGSPGLLKVGFNHRYHLGIRRAHELVTAGFAGSPIAVRARYGHGGRPGYEREWRGNARLAGGGELTDQGVHVADLLHWFLGLPSEAFAYTSTAFWPIAPLEDNAFGLLRYEGGCVASLHTSWTQWKNLFSFEFLGTEGSVCVDGLGGSYGEEHLTFATRNQGGGAPHVRVEPFDGPDRSWEAEWSDFVTAMLEGSAYEGTPDDGLAAARIVSALYESARDGRPVALAP